MSSDLKTRVTVDLGDVGAQELEKVKEFLGIKNSSDCIRFLIKNFSRKEIS